ncbi:hypothetical protein B0T18DRAFT_478584 [Schizothecium vesticola]|uniref:Uncharacterized protein n=1 Tax=Schizothecium vesticola TaxID=314040 RepID=A0AA40F6K1_9PEZI|nr:hypothetical protein B0T18DRAFT_478584 [Schizothecium vesticola]
MGHHLQTTVNYYADPGDGSPPTPVYVGSTQVTNKRPTISVPVTVTDVTGNESAFTLDVHGFAYHRHESAEAADGFHDETALKQRYYPECEELLRTLTGATRVLAFDHKVRRGPAFWHALNPTNNTASRGPLHNAHVDQSYAGAVLRLRDVLPPTEADAIVRSGRRWQILNVWRPIKEVRSSPLAVADARSVADEDLVAASIMYGTSGRRMESWAVKAPPAGEGREHGWFYKWRQGVGEVVVIKCFDSLEEEGVARRAVHCAVEDVRCLVFY